MSETPRPLELHYLTRDEVKALAADPENWRRHPESQAEGLVAAAAHIESLTDDDVAGRGMIAPLTFNRRLERLQDGHLRQDEVDRLPATEDLRIPVLFGDWNEEQQRAALATRDPLAALAETDELALAELLESIEPEDEGTAELLKRIGETTGARLPDEPEAPSEFPEVDENIQTDHECPKCGYTWSGSTKPSE